MTSLHSSPLAPKRPHSITQHGQTRIDNYFWMRHKEDPEVISYLRAESDYQEEVMQHTQGLQENLFLEMKDRIKETDSSAPEKNGNYFYYTRTEAGAQYPIYCRKKDLFQSPEEILLDQNKLAEGKSFCRIGAFSVSPDGCKLAYSVDADGSEKCILYIKDLTNDTLYPEIIENTWGSVYNHSGVEWDDNSQVLFYVKQDEALRPYKLYRHNLGTDINQDILVFHEADETFFLFVLKTRSKAFIMTYHVSTNTREMRFLDANQPTSALKLIQERKRGIEYFATHHADYFFILSNEDAQNFRLMRTSTNTPGREYWSEVIPHRPEILVEELEAFENHLVLIERKNGLYQIRISAQDGISNVHYVQFPEPSYVILPEKNPEFTSQLFRFTYTSLVTPNSIIDYGMDNATWQAVKEQDIPSGYDRKHRAYGLLRLYVP
ncbi:MAG: hypothetical protein WCK35_12940 [Chloroflexota bacterium]